MSLRSTRKTRNNRKRSKVFDPSTNNKKKKRDEAVFDEASNDHLSIIKKHLLTQTNKDINKTLDEMCNELGLNENLTEDDLSDDSVDAGVPKPRTSVEDCIEKMFEGLDDYASFDPRRFGSTPKPDRKGYSSVDSAIKPTPAVTPAASRFKSILKSNSSSSIACKSNETPLLGTAGPFLDGTAPRPPRTPLSDKTNLTPESNSLLGSATPVTYLPPNSFCTPARSTPFLSKKSLSPGLIEVSPEVKKTLLKGVACYVDVKTNREDCSASVALELVSMGATAEKTFNKKVTHVVFKDGKPSTYLKAKRLGVVMVSVLWLEACKRERGLVDPALYPPINSEAYESLSPSGKKIPSLKTIQRKLRKHFLREGGLSADNTKKVRINWRNALTEFKVSRHRQPSGQARFCTKKLDFCGVSSPGILRKTVISVSDYNIKSSADEEIWRGGADKGLGDKGLDNTDKSGDCRVGDSREVFGDAGQVSGDENNGVLASYDKVSQDANRVLKGSAKVLTEASDNLCASPMGCDLMRGLPEGRKRKKNQDEKALSQGMLTIDQLFAKQTGPNKKIKLSSDKENEIGSQVIRKKLFNPDEVIVIGDTPEDKGTPPQMEYRFPYEDRPTPQPAKSTSMKKVFKKIVRRKPAAQRSLSSLLERNESSDSRASLSCFVDTKDSVPKPPRERPSIVCTSLLPEQARRVAYVVGKLGVFDVEPHVSSRTTHLVTPAPRRTVNLLKALARGAWILHTDWIYQSEKAGSWQNEEAFELKTFSPAVTELRRERQAMGPDFRLELLRGSGPLYLSRRCAPAHADLAELVRLCGGRVAPTPASAHLLIGGKVREGEEARRVKEKWILDSLSQNTVLDWSRYLLTSETCDSKVPAN